LYSKSILNISWIAETGFTRIKSNEIIDTISIIEIEWCHFPTEFESSQNFNALNSSSIYQFINSSIYQFINSSIHRFINSQNSSIKMLNMFSWFVPSSNHIPSWICHSQW
jgi:hypothetical protein